MTMNEHKKNWIADQISLWKTLEGKNVEVVGLQEPLDWKDPDDTVPIFQHPSILFQHLSMAFFKSSDGSCLKVMTAQDEDIFGLYILNEAVLKLVEGLVGLNCSGYIKTVDVTVCEDNIGKVELTYDSFTRILTPGEVEPTHGGYIIRQMDESVLIFDSQKDFERTKFGTETDIDLTI